jgi:hypothetical protein
VTDTILHAAPGTCTRVPAIALEEIGLSRQLEAEGLISTRPPLPKD